MILKNTDERDGRARTLRWVPRVLYLRQPMWGLEEVVVVYEVGAEFGM